MKYTLTLIFIIIIFFVLQISFKDFTDLIDLKKDLLFSQPHRLVTHLFAHGSSMHLIYNLFALFLFGIYLELIFRKKHNFLIIFFFSGIMAGFISAFFYSSSLGASGAISGLIASLAILRPTMIIYWGFVPLPLIVAAFIWLFLDIQGAIYGYGSIGYIAHIVGFIIGLIFGIYFKFGKKHSYGRI